MRLRLLLPLLLITAAASAQEPLPPEKVLVPVFNNTPLHGANGSTFATSLSLFGPRVTYYPAFAPPNPDPVVGTSHPEGLPLPLWEAPVVAKGRFLFIERADEQLLAETVTATAPDGSTASTPLPLVTVRGVLTGKATFFPLPVTPILSDLDPNSPEHYHLLGWRERHTLRVYDWDSTGTLEVVVSLRWGSFLSRGAVIVPLKVNTRDFDDFTYPYYAELDLVQAFAKHGYCFPGLHIACVAYPAIFEVEPTTPGARYYAFISTTDNATNHVAIYTPR
jgi:hypothetical protein